MKLLRYATKGALYAVWGLLIAVSAAVYLGLAYAIAHDALHVI